MHNKQESAVRELGKHPEEGRHRDHGKTSNQPHLPD